MGLLPGFKNDIFISYNRADDLRGEVPDGMNGWVGSFATKIKAGMEGLLKKELADAGKPGIDVFWDYNLERDQQVTSTLKDHVENSAMFIVIMSGHYLNSDWCGKESHWFQDIASSRRTALTSRACTDNFHPLILAHIGQTDRALWPAHLANSDLLGYDFFHKDITTGGAHKLGTRYCYPTIDINSKELSPFYDELSRLKSALHKRFKQALAVPVAQSLVRPHCGQIISPVAAPQGATAATPPLSGNGSVTSPGPNGRVLLVASHNGGPAHNEVAAAFAKAGVETVQPAEAHHGMDWDDAAGRARSMLMLLGKPNGERDVHLTEALNAAEHHGLDIHAWMPAEIPLAKIEALDADFFGAYKALFDRVKGRLIQCPVTDLAPRIAATYRQAAAPKTGGERIRIYVDADRIDRDIVDDLIATLNDDYVESKLAAHRIRYKVEPPLFDASTRANNEIYERIKENNGVIVVYGRIDTSTLEYKIDSIEKKSIEREAESGKEIRVTIHDGPKPDARATPLLIFSGMSLINARRTETYRDQIVKFFVDTAADAQAQRSKN
jgi:TIR domain